MKKLKNEEYVNALWKCYTKGMAEGLDAERLFTLLVDDVIEQVIGKTKRVRVPRKSFLKTWAVPIGLIVFFVAFNLWLHFTGGAK